MTPQYIYINEIGSKRYYKDKEMTIFHREDGPAIEWSAGVKSWYINGQFHRTDGPAIESPDGYKAWYIDGKRHRLDGHAIEYANGDKYWYLNGKKLTEEEFLERNASEIVLTMDEIAAKLGIEVSKLKIKK